MGTILAGLKDHERDKEYEPVEVWIMKYHSVIRLGKIVHIAHLHVLINLASNIQ